MARKKGVIRRGVEAAGDVLTGIISPGLQREIVKFRPSEKKPTKMSRDAQILAPRTAKPISQQALAKKLVSGAHIRKPRTAAEKEAIRALRKKKNL